MPSEDEIKFAKNRYKIQDAVCACFSTVELLLPIQLKSGGARLDSVVGDLQPDTLSGQQLVQSRTYTSPNADSPEKVEVAIGYTGANWTPIVTVTSTSSDPEQVIFDGDFGQALQSVFVLITQRVKRAVGD